MTRHEACGIPGEGRGLPEEWSGDPAREATTDEGQHSRAEGRIAPAARQDEHMEVTFAEDHLRFDQYDFPGAMVYPHGTLTPSQIRDADWQQLGLQELRTHADRNPLRPVPAAGRAQGVLRPPPP